MSICWTSNELRVETKVSVRIAYNDLHTLVKDAKGIAVQKPPNILQAKTNALLGHLGGSVKRPTWAQVTTSQFVSLSPASSSVLTARGLEPGSDSLSAPPPLVLSQKRINVKKKIVLK